MLTLFSFLSHCVNKLLFQGLGVPFKSKGSSSNQKWLFMVIPQGNFFKSHKELLTSWFSFSLLQNGTSQSAEFKSSSSWTTDVDLASVYRVYRVHMLLRVYTQRLRNLHEDVYMLFMFSIMMSVGVFTDVLQWKPSIAWKQFSLFFSSAQRFIIDMSFVWILKNPSPNREGSLWNHLSLTYNAILSSFPRRLNNRLHLASGDYSNWSNGY